MARYPKRIRAIRASSLTKKSIDSYIRKKKGSKFVITVVFDNDDQIEKITYLLKANGCEIEKISTRQIKHRPKAYKTKARCSYGSFRTGTHSYLHPGMAYRGRLIPNIDSRNSYITDIVVKPPKPKEPRPLPDPTGKPPQGE